MRAENPEADAVSGAQMRRAVTDLVHVARD